MQRTLADLIKRSHRIRTISPQEWREFTQLWMAFNAVYGGEPDRVERSRVMRCIRRFFSEHAALKVLRSVTRSVDRVLEVPPGDMRIDSRDPNFRAATTRCTALYRDRNESSIGRLAAIGGIVYQVRCNLMHGAKDPGHPRDLMLVSESLAILRALVPALEKQAAANAA